MIVGIPKGLLYYRYFPFVNTFFKELGAEIITSADTNREILNQGTKYCVDEACLPVKVFHGHVASITSKCDFLFLPRVMQIYKGEFICPKFCGLPEMITNSIPNLPKCIKPIVYAYSKNRLFKFALDTGLYITNDRNKIFNALKIAIANYRDYKFFTKEQDYKINVAIVGHPYNIYDNFVNMDIVKKLNNLEVGVITMDSVSKIFKQNETQNLFKRPFWTFGREEYCYAANISNYKEINGIVYISSFGCGIDSIIVELIKEKIGSIPFLMLKIDEHTGDVGLETRIEAFTDMIKRRYCFDNNFSAFR